MIVENYIVGTYSGVRVALYDMSINFRLDLFQTTLKVIVIIMYTYIRWLHIKYLSVNVPNCLVM